LPGALVGRTSEIAHLAALGAGRVVTLWGPGGVGKTRLAREHADRERERGRVVVWTDLAAARTSAEAIAVLAASLGVVLADEEGVEALARAACAQRALLVADNVEQLDAGARAALIRVANVVTERGGGAAGGATLLVTSRELLGANDEVALVVAPLDEDDALALFASLSGTGPSAAARTIVRRLDALPLAIELAAARVPLLGVTELLARLDRKLDVLGTAKSDRPARHATLRAAITWSWELLEDDERDALLACATFEAPFDAALAEAVIDGDEADALNRLERLRARALVHATTDSRGRVSLRLLESVRDFAREVAAADAERSARLEHRHAAAVVARCEPLADDALCGKDALAELEARRADLVAASRRPGPARAGATLALATLLAISGPAAAAVASIDAAIADSEATGTGTIIARLLVAKGDALRAVGKLMDAREALAHASKRASDLGDSRQARLITADAARILGSVLRGVGVVDEALAQKDKALAIYRDVGDRPREGICLGEIGAVHQSEGRLALAKSCHAAAIAIHVATGARRAEGVDRSYLAVATHRAGDPAASIALHEQALAIHREIGHRRLEGAELLHLGFVRHELGELAASREAFAAARTLLVAAGAQGLEAIALVFAARLEVDAGDATSAMLLLAEANQVTPASWPRVAATRHLIEGHLAMSTGAPDRARLSYEASLATSRDLEVGVEALTPAYLAVAIARSTRAPIDGYVAAARERVAPLENPHLHAALELLVAAASGGPAPDVAASSAAASSDVRRALALAGVQRGLVIDADGRRVELPDGRVIDLSRRKSVRLVLLELARARSESPGRVVLPEALLEAGWAGERMRPEAATKRLHTAIWTLRSLGFEALLATEGEGYLLDPRIGLRRL
jgi:predicted ATPase